MRSVSPWNRIILASFIAAAGACAGQTGKAPLDLESEDSFVIGSGSSADSAKRPTIIGEIESAGGTVTGRFSGSFRYLGWHFQIRLV